MHFEIELGLVMGKTLRDYDERDEQGAIDAIESTSVPVFFYRQAVRPGNGWWTTQIKCSADTDIQAMS
jgi:hypothetical protein